MVQIGRKGRPGVFWTLAAWRRHLVIADADTSDAAQRWTLKSLTLSDPAVQSPYRTQDVYRA
ncbi:hypothetical protein [Xenorhabdus doucetiae]|uniref:hypothetical protein n=1 Tax=Xenorhabdus doucetiae TaxID=351671 RepID=UPI0011E8424F|nr:hypothetical protein [Xenorhabdus doucetiae]